MDIIKKDVDKFNVFYIMNDLSYYLIGTSGRIRTGKDRNPVDFESTASTNFATLANTILVYHIFLFMQGELQKKYKIEKSDKLNLTLKKYKDCHFF